MTSVMPLTDASQAPPNGSVTSRVRPTMSAFTDSPNARSKTVEYMDGTNTHGLLNRLPSIPTSYTIGISEDRGARRTMEDAHSFIVDFAGIKGQGYFGIFDGHAGKHAAEWCGQHFHEFLLEELASLNDRLIPDAVAKTFLKVDSELSRMSADGTTHSGCTAVTAFLRLENNEGKQPFAPAITPMPVASSSSSISSVTSERSDTSGTTTPPSSTRGKLKEKLSNTFSGRKKNSQDKTILDAVKGPAAVEVEGATRRVLYTANVGDARAVLCRNGKAVRLTHDHKGSDKAEVKRIVDAGGFVMNNRVNGVLAVTRSLGDTSMKEFVVGSPYTTETDLSDDDEFLIIACDGLWDVAEDQEAVDLIKRCKNGQEASDILLKHALDSFSNDNVSVLVIKFGVPSRSTEGSVTQ